MIDQQSGEQQREIDDGIRKSFTRQQIIIVPPDSPCVPEKNQT
jgi:hypothetical protein